MAELVPIFYEVRPEWESLLRGFLLHLGPAGAGGQFGSFLAFFGGVVVLVGLSAFSTESDGCGILSHTGTFSTMRSAAQELFTNSLDMRSAPQ